MSSETRPAADPASSQSGLKRWLPLLVIGAAMAVVLAMGWHRELTFENLALKRGELHAFVSRHLLAAVAIYIVIYIAVVALSLPGAGVLSISGGMLFGAWIAAPAIVIAATTGAVIIFLVTRSSLGAALAERAGPWLERFRAGFEKEGLAYMLFLRLMPFPFFIINLVPAVLGVPLRTFFIGTFFGIMPATVAFAYLGDTLDRVVTDARTTYDACVAKSGATACKLSVDVSSLPFRQIAVALVLIGLVALIPPVLNRWRARHAAV